MQYESRETKLTGKWQRHTICQYSQYVQEGTRKIPALLQMPTEHLDYTSEIPYLVYMPEKDRLLILVTAGENPCPSLMFSDDHGATWTDPKPMHPDVKSGMGMGVGLAYLGKGKVMLSIEQMFLQVMAKNTFEVASELFRRFFSDDFGETWNRSAPMPGPGDGLAKHEWDPPFIDRDPDSGDVLRIISTAYQYAAFYGPHYDPYRGCLRISTDLGQTWSADDMVPQWRGLSETALVRAANGDLVAACRTDWLEEHQYYQHAVIDSDHYMGLGHSISKDNGQTWSDVKILYRYGRHHPSMVVLPNDDIVMSYVVRKGYPKHPSGHDRYGIEAIVSHDHGQSWDSQPYILHTWSATRKDKHAWWASSQSTSTVLLPDGDILTSFSTGVRCGPDGAPRDVGLIRWTMDA